MKNFTSNNKHYISWYTYNDVVKEIKLSTSRVYNPDFQEDIMNFKIYTIEEQEENYNNAMQRLEKANSYEELAQVAKDIKAAADSARSTGDFIFPYDKELGKNKLSIFWEKYFESKESYVNLAIAEVNGLIKEHNKEYMLNKVKQAIFNITILKNKQYLDIKKKLWSKCDEKIAELQAVA